MISALKNPDTFTDPHKQKLCENNNFNKKLGMLVDTKQTKFIQ